MILTLGLVLFNVGCAHTISSSKVMNTLDIARANAEKRLTNHHALIPNGAYIAKVEVFYDISNQPKLYEFVLMKGSEDVGSYFGDVKTGEASEGVLHKSMSYGLDEYYSTILEVAFQLGRLKVIEKRRISGGIEGNSWRIRFAPPIAVDSMNYVKTCSIPEKDGWFQFKQGINSICEGVLDSDPPPMPN